MIAAVLFMGISAAAAPRRAATKPGSPQDVLTYHGDNLRTGWFSSETQLTASNVNAKSFGLLHTVPLDGRVDAEPLVVMQQQIQGHGIRNVVYVATENNTIYAIDAGDGTVLWQRRHGTAVPCLYKYPRSCNVFPVMGILGTPVIDRIAGAMYFVTDNYDGKVDTFYLHAMSLSTGRDLFQAGAIRFTTQLPAGKKWTLNPRFHLQRPGLLAANGSIYVAFGSVADLNPDQSRGTILRYDAATLQQSGGQLADQLSHRPVPYYLSSIWQSGYAPAADANGDVYFSTANSDPRNPSYSATRNLPESMVHLSSDLSTLVDSFTTYNYFALDQADHDMGSGGMLLLPDQPGSVPHLAVAGGKDGRAFLLNRDQLGGFTKGGPDKVLQVFQMGPCWCGPAYFVGSDLAAHVLTGGRHGVMNWGLQTSPAPQLTLLSSTGPGPVSGVPDDGTFPVVSSNGTTEGSAVVWFVQKPATNVDNDPGAPVTLMAYAASDLTQPLLSIQAGTWTHGGKSNANLVPTVANGRVYVASNKQLQIFGLLSGEANAQSKHGVILNGK
jgi:hypothetical protein